MQELKTKVNDLSEDVEAYIEAYYELKVLKLSEKISLIASQSLAATALILLIVFVLAFSGIAMGWWLGTSLDNMAAGFSIVAGIYALLLILLIAMKNNIVVPRVRNMIIKKMYEEYDNEL